LPEEHATDGVHPGAKTDAMRPVYSKIWWASWLEIRASEYDGFAPYRDRILYALALAGVALFLPLAIYGFLQEQIAVGICICSAVLISAVNAIAVYRKKTPLPLALMILPGVAAFLLAVHGQGLGSILWDYPALILFYFVLSRSLANVLALVLMAVLIPESLRLADARITVCLVVTMILTAIFANLLVGMIAGLQTTWSPALPERLSVTGVPRHRHRSS
jgi:hypothetical protein